MNNFGIDKNRRFLSIMIISRVVIRMMIREVWIIKIRMNEWKWYLTQVVRRNCQLLILLNI